MLPEWIQRVGSSVPRGFSRFFILDLLKKKQYTGKELIDFAVKQSDGKWKPSPGLIYPLLGRLLDEKLIQETTGGKYKLTKKCSTTTDDLETINNIVKNQLDVIFRIGNVGRFVALDMIERVYTLGSVLSENASQMSKEEIEKYKKFLKSEMQAITMTNGLAIHAVKDDGSPASRESMMTYAFIINQNPAVRLYQDTLDPEYIEDVKAFYEKVISHHKREYGYIWGIDAYTLEDTPLGVKLNQRATGIIGNKINLTFVPSDNVKIVWTKIGNFELTEPFIVHFNEPGRFNAIKFDYGEKSIFFETIENEGTVTFSGAIKSVLVDGQNYFNFNEKTLNTLEGKHNYKVTLID